MEKGNPRSNIYIFTLMIKLSYRKKAHQNLKSALQIIFCGFPKPLHDLSLCFRLKAVPELLTALNCDLITSCHYHKNYFQFDQKPNKTGFYCFRKYWGWSCSDSDIDREKFYSVLLRGQEY